MLGRASAVVGNLYLASANVYAQSAGDILPPGPVDGDLTSLIQTVLKWVLTFAIVIAVVIIIFAGIQYITANGDDAKIKKATQTLTWAVIGLVVAFIAQILVTFVMNNILKTQQYS